MQADGCIDLEAFRRADAARQSDPQPAAKSPRPRRQPYKRKFVQMPWIWLDALASVNAPGSAYRLAAYLLYEAWRRDSDRIKLANVSLGERGVTRFSKYRALPYLRKAGLIAMDGRPKRSPIVTLHFWR